MVNSVQITLQTDAMMKKQERVYVLEEVISECKWYEFLLKWSCQRKKKQLELELKCEKEVRMAIIEMWEELKRRTP